jgi:hypothetical protein
MCNRCEEKNQCPGGTPALVRHLEGPRSCQRAERSRVGPRVQLLRASSLGLRNGSATDGAIGNAVKKQRTAVYLALSSSAAYSSRVFTFKATNGSFTATY